MSTNYAIDGKLGVSVESGASSAQEFPLLTVARINANQTAIYALVSEAATFSSSSAVPLALNAAGTASASAGGFKAMQTFAAGEYGWILASAADVTLA